MKYMFSAGIIPYQVVDNTILYLLLQYSAGHWEFPKGKIEKGEDKQQAAHRELMEETGLTAEIDPNFEETFDYIFTDYIDKQLAHKTVYFFIGKAKSKKVVLSYEHQNYAWLTYDDAMNQLTYKNAKAVLETVNEYLLQLIDHGKKAV